MVQVIAADSCFLHYGPIEADLKWNGVERKLCCDAGSRVDTVGELGVNVGAQRGH